jgi:hypothetical protein
VGPSSRPGLPAASGPSGSCGGVLQVRKSMLTAVLSPFRGCTLESEHVFAHPLLVRRRQVMLSCTAAPGPTCHSSAAAASSAVPRSVTLHDTFPGV